MYFLHAFELLYPSATQTTFHQKPLSLPAIMGSVLQLSNTSPMTARHHKTQTKGQECWRGKLSEENSGFTFKSKCLGVIEKRNQVTKTHRKCNSGFCG